MWIITATQLQKKQLAKSGYNHSSIYTWQELMRHCAQRVSAEPMHFLNRIEERVLWLQAVKQLSENEQTTLLPLVKNLQEAYQLIWQFEIPLSALVQNSDYPGLIFYSLIEKFNKLCQKNQLADVSKSFQQLLGANDFSWLPKKMIFYGFFVKTPLQMRVIEKFMTADIKVEEKTCEEKPAIAITKLWRFEHSSEVFESVVEKIHQWRHKNPAEKIAIVVNDVKKWQRKLATVALRTNDEMTAMIDMPLIKIAIALIQLKFTQAWSLLELEKILHSPYWGDMPNQMVVRAKFLGNLRQLLLTEIKPDFVIAMAKDFPEIENALLHLRSKKSNSKKTLTTWFEEWKIFFSHIHFANAQALALHYPEQYSAIKIMLEAWENIPLLLEKYFPWGASFTEREALGVLEQICHQQIVSHVESEHESPIEILSPLDALTQHFDCMIWLDVRQDMVILPVYRNIFLSRKIQTDFALWGMDALFNVELASMCFDRFRQEVGELYVVHTEEEGGRLPRFCEGVLEDVRMAEEEPSSGAGDHPLPQKENQSRARQQAEQGAIDPWQKATLLGSTAALRAQALCSMQAFATYRLRAKPLPEAQLGLSAIEKGLVIHRALHLIWKNLQTQAALIELSDEALMELLTKTVTLALQQVPWVRRKQLPHTLFLLEQQFLIQLLMQWMVSEKTRPAFKVYALEQDAQVLFANHKWRLRIDRIDELSDGKLLLLDYKTGLASMQNCLPESLTEPQLPFYAVTESHAIDGIAFGEISAKKIRMSGFASELITLGAFGNLQKIADWQDLNQQWREKLTQLTDAFVHSQGQLNPRDASTTCNRCGMQSFCRIFETDF